MNTSRIKIGIAPLTWTNDDLPELGGHISFEQCIAEMKQAGYTGCEVGNKFPTDPKELLKALKPYDLQIASQWCSLHFTVKGRFDETIRRFKRQLKFLKNVGAKVIVVCEKGGSIQEKQKPMFGHDKVIFDDNDWKKFILGLNQIGEIAKENNMQVAYHQHMGTGVQSENELQRFLENTQPELTSLLYDTGHIACAGMDPTDIVKQYAHRISHVHLKDVRANIVTQIKKNHLSFLDGVKAGCFTVPGDGYLDFKSIIDALLERNYHGWFVVEAEQDPDKAPPLQYAIMGREYIRKISGL